jgi:hypothetical protein
MKRSQEQIDEIISRTGETVVFEKYLTADEVSHLLGIFKRDNEKIFKSSGPVNGIPPWDDAVFKSIVDRVCTDMNVELEIFGGNYFNVKVPHGIHNDVPKDDHSTIPAKCIVIPLEKIYRDDWEHRDDDAQFYVFDQMYVEGPVKCYKGGPEMDSPFNIPLYDYSDIYGIHEDCRKPEGNFKHLMQKRWLEGFSIEKTCNWVPGDVIVFDCARIHCASAFTRNGIMEKTGLSIFASYR